MPQFVCEFNDGTQHENELRELDEWRLCDSDVEENIIERHSLFLDVAAGSGA